MAARLLLELAYDTREEGITYGGEGPAAQTTTTPAWQPTFTANSI